jgi:hypothetical protein
MDLTNGTLLAGLAAVLALLIAVALWLRSRRRKRSSIGDALAAIAFDHIEHSLVPDGMGGEIHIEHLLLTARGVLVVDVKRYQGVIFASDRLDSWTAIGPGGGRASFPNPLGNLYDRVAAVRQLVRDIEVTGYVVFPGEADFSKGRPASVALPDDLVEKFAVPEPDEMLRLKDAFSPHWDKLRLALQPASP